jgi:putative PIN family toxin of toxin-antitoxin system
MIKVVIDTNVIIAALRSKNGFSHRLVFSIGLDSRWKPMISGPLLSEYSEQVISQRMVKNWTYEDCDDFLDYLCAESGWSEVHFLWRPLLADEDDHIVLEAAMASSAERIITFNKTDLKPSESFGIRLQTPREFLESL